MASASTSTNVKDNIPNVYICGLLADDIGGNEIKVVMSIGVYWGDGDPKNFSERLAGRVHRFRCEIYAAEEAVNTARKTGIREINVFTDSRYLHDSVTNRLLGWMQSDWKTRSGREVENCEDFKVLMHAMEDVKVNWFYCPLESNNLGILAAESLAYAQVKHLY